MDHLRNKHIKITKNATTISNKQIDKVLTINRNHRSRRSFHTTSLLQSNVLNTTPNIEGNTELENNKECINPISKSNSKSNSNISKIPSITPIPIKLQTKIR